jgi:hypothetical protein
VRFFEQLGEPIDDPALLLSRPAAFRRPIRRMSGNLTEIR